MDRSRTPAVDLGFGRGGLGDSQNEKSPGEAGTLGRGGVESNETNQSYARFAC